MGQIRQIIAVVINIFYLPDFLTGDNIMFKGLNYYKHDNRYVVFFGIGS